MIVEILEAALNDRDPATGDHYRLAQGDVVTVPDYMGARWCMNGWAKDTAGIVATVERIPGARRALSVQDANLRGH